MTPDLEIRVTTEGGNRLAYVLRYAEGKGKKFDRRIEGPKLHSRPRQYQLRVLKRLELLGKQLGTHNEALKLAEVEQELAALGHDLYKELFPRELRAEYSQLRQQERIRSLLVVSDEPWIPWEIVKPYGTEGDDHYDDDFLCCRFEMTRWLEKGGALLTEIEAVRVAAVEAAAPESSRGLRHAGEEVQFLEAIARRREGVEFRALRSATHPDVKDLLETGGNGVLLFVGHGEFEADDPDESRFLLDDGRALRPRDLHGPMETKLQHDRPLVFFNSCQVAQQDFSLTRIGGWAARWVRECGAGAFVGPQWSVDDGLACLFSQTFFAALDGGATFGQAARTARLRVKEEEPGNPSWLAYTIYAHPNGRLRLGSRSPSSSAVPQPQPLPLVLDTGSFTVDRRRRRSRRRMLAQSTIVVLALLIVAAGGLYWRFVDDTKSAASDQPDQHSIASAPAGRGTIPPPTSDVHARQEPPYRQDAVRLYFVLPETVDSALWRDRIEKTADAKLTAVGLVRTQSPNAAWLAVIEASEATLSQGATGRICNVRASLAIYHKGQRVGEVAAMTGTASQFTDTAACEAAIHKVAERVSHRVVSAYMDQSSED